MSYLEQSNKSVSLPIFCKDKKSKSNASSKVLPKRYVKDSRTFVQFRITLEEYPKLLELAEEACKEGQIKAPTISCFAKASLIKIANFAIRIKEENEKIKEADKKRRELQAIAPSNIPYANPLTQYMKF